MQAETTLADDSLPPIVIDFRVVLEKISEEDFENLCLDNPEMELELTRKGELIITSPTK